MRTGGGEGRRPGVSDPPLSPAREMTSPPPEGRGPQPRALGFSPSPLLLTTRWNHEKWPGRGAWVAPWAECPTLGLGSSHDLRVLRLSWVGLPAQCRVSLRAPAPPPTLSGGKKKTLPIKNKRFHVSHIKWFDQIFNSNKNKYQPPSGREPPDHKAHRSPSTWLHSRVGAVSAARSTLKGTADLPS